MKRALALISTGIVAAALASTASAAPGTLPLGPPWGSADQTDTNQVEVSYTVKANGNIPGTALTAVERGIARWNSAIDNREPGGSGWDFDIVSFAGAGGAVSASKASGPKFSKARGPKLFSHKPTHNPPGQGGGPPGGGGDGDNGGADLTIQVKKGGGAIAGSAQRTLDADGFVVAVKIQISGGAFGIANDPDTIQQVTEHEVGHALALGHHSNEADLMGQTVGYEDGGPSACDLDGFVAAHRWLTGAAPHAGSIVCLP